MSNKINIQWNLSATSGMVGADIDEEFIESLSPVELDYFADQVINVLYMVGRKKGEAYFK